MELTKREEFAKAAMKGLLSNPDYKEDAQTLVADAVWFADKLLWELDKTS